MLTLNSIVDVRVNAAHAASVSTTFSTGLILAPAASTTVTDAQRLRLFTSAEDMLADPSGDFTASSPAYLAAKSYFAASRPRTASTSPSMPPTAIPPMAWIPSWTGRTTSTVSSLRKPTRPKS